MELNSNVASYIYACDIDVKFIYVLCNFTSSTFISTDRPIIELSNSTLMVNEDSSVTLPCDVIANPPAYVQWFHNVHQVNVSDGEYLYGELCN